MFYPAAIEVLFNLKAGPRRRDSLGGGRTRLGKWIPFLWASDTRDVWSDLESDRLPFKITSIWKLTLSIKENGIKLFIYLFSILEGKKAAYVQLGVIFFSLWVLASGFAPLEDLSYYLLNT